MLLKINTIEELINTIVVEIINLYHRPIFKRFDIIEFQTKKSKLHIIVYNLIELQKRIKIVPGALDTIRYYTNELSKENNYPKIFKFLNKLYDKLENDIFSIDYLRGEVLNLIVILLKDDTNKKYKELSAYKNRRNPKTLEYSEIVSGLEDLTLNLEDYKKWINEINVLMRSDIEGFINIFPEYDSRFIEADIQIMETINYITSGSIYDKLILPEKVIEFINPIKKYTIRSSMDKANTKMFFGTALFEKFIRILDYKKYSKNQNLKFLRERNVRQ